MNRPGSVRIEVAILQRHDVGFVDDLVPKIQDENDWNDQVVGYEIEP